MMERGAFAFPRDHNVPETIRRETQRARCGFAVAIPTACDLWNSMIARDPGGGGVAGGLQSAGEFGNSHADCQSAGGAGDLPPGLNFLNKMAVRFGITRL